MNLKGTWPEGTLVDLAWPLGYGLIGLGVAHLLANPPADAAGDERSDDAQDPVPSVCRAVLPYFVLPFAALVVYIEFPDNDHTPAGRGAYAWAVLLIAVVVCGRSSRSARTSASTGTCTERGSAPSPKRQASGCAGRPGRPAHGRQPRTVPHARVRPGRTHAAPLRRVHPPRRRRRGRRPVPPARRRAASTTTRSRNATSTRTATSCGGG